MFLNQPSQDRPGRLIETTHQCVVDATFNLTRGTWRSILKAPEKFVFPKTRSNQQITTSAEPQPTVTKNQNECSVLKIASSLTQSAAGEQP